jgi:hypothetical protein
MMRQVWLMALSGWRREVGFFQYFTRFRCRRRLVPWKLNCTLLEKPLAHAGAGTSCGLRRAHSGWLLLHNYPVQYVGLDSSSRSRLYAFRHCII